MFENEPSDLPMGGRRRRRFRSLIEAVETSSIYMLSRDGRIRSWNAGAERNEGYAAAEILGEPFNRLFRLRDAQDGLPERLLTEAAEQGQIAVEGWCRRKSGEEFWAILGVTALYDETGRLDGFAVVTSNLTERKQNEEILKASEERFRAAMEHSAIGMALVGIDGTVLRANGALCAMLECELSTLEDQNFHAACHPEDSGIDLELRRNLIDGKIDNYRIEKRYRCADGHYVWGLLNVSLVRAHDGSPLHFICQVQDIDALKRAEAALHAERDRLQVTLYAIGDGVISTDLEGRIELMNAAACEMTGWSLEEARGHRVEDVFKVVDSESGLPIENPIYRSIADRHVVSMPGNLALLGRHGERREIQDSAAPIVAKSGSLIGSVLVFQDVTVVRNIQRELRFNATHDALTGLPNRRYFEQTLDDALRQIRGTTNQHTLCFLDLDRFKIVNDTAGHAAGDTLLCAVARLIRRAVGETDLVARLGGDEFAIILFNRSVEAAKEVIGHLVESLQAMQFPWENRIFRVSGSIGMVGVSPLSESRGQLMRYADIACYAAKRAGRNRYSVYETPAGAHPERQRELLMAADLREALADGRFRLFAQTIVSARGDTYRHYELLLRMVDREGNLVQPSHFIPAAEHYDVMADLDRWVLSQMLTKHAKALARIPDLSISVNLSANSLNDTRFFPFFLDLIERSTLPPERLTIEVTETAVINNISIASRTLEQLRDLGCKIALDDFGVGVGSFTYLRSFKVDFVKIEGSFVRNVNKSRIESVIVQSINNIAHELGAKTIAEFVEDDDILRTVQMMGVDYAQGYAISKPTPLEDVLERA